MIRHVCRILFVLALVVLAPVSFAAVTTYTAYMDGPSEPTVSLGTGFARVDYDDIAQTMRVRADFSGLTGTTTVAHIHAPTASPFAGTVGVAVTPGTLPGFPVGVTSGAYDVTLDLTSTSNWTASFLSAHGGTTAAAETAFFSYMDTGRAYFNVHSSIYPGGEIRGFFVPVPEPTTIGLMLVGSAGMLLSWRGRSRA